MDRFKTFTLLIAKIYRNVRRIKTQAMSEHQLKSPHVSCLYYLYKNKSLTMRQLCEVCNEDKSGISRSVEHLEKEGLVIRQGADGMVYKTQLTLTEKGAVVGGDICEKIDFVLSETSKNVSDEEREIFYKCLKEISDNLDRIVISKQ